MHQESRWGPIQAPSPHPMFWLRLPRDAVMRLPRRCLGRHDPAKPPMAPAVSWDLQLFPSFTQWREASLHGAGLKNPW